MGAVFKYFLFGPIDERSDYPRTTVGIFSDKATDHFNKGWTAIVVRRAGMNTKSNRIRSLVSQN